MAKAQSKTATVDHSNLRPFNDRVIIKADAAEQKTDGGIIIPDTAKEKPSKGTIVAIGPGRKDEPTEGKPGERVLYGKYSGTEIENNGETLLVMREDELLTRF